MRSVHDPAPPVLSIVIPVLDEAHLIDATLDAVGSLRGLFEVIVADGGSEDGTATIVRQRGVEVVVAERGRGSQMHAGAQAARGDILWFLHADTIPPIDGVERILEALGDPGVVGGNFTLILSGTRRPARFLTWLYPWLRWLGICYGDSAFFVRRSVYEEVGGFRPIPIFEDLDLLRRLRLRGRFIHLPSRVVTSSRNFEGVRFAPVFARWVLLQVLYTLGVSAARLGRLDVMMRRRNLPAVSVRIERGGGEPR